MTAVTRQLSRLVRKASTEYKLIQSVKKNMDLSITLFPAMVDVSLLRQSQNPAQGTVKKYNHTINMQSLQHPQASPARLGNILDCWGTFCTKNYAFFSISKFLKSHTYTSAQEPTCKTLLLFRDTRLKHLGCIGSELYQLSS